MDLSLPINKAPLHVLYISMCKADVGSSNVEVLPPETQELTSVAVQLEWGGCAQGNEAPYPTETIGELRCSLNYLSFLSRFTA